VKARVVAPARGAYWLAEGWRMFRAAPLGWLVLVFAYLMASMLVSVLPLVGPALVSILVPAISVGFMSASRAAARGQPVGLAMLFAGFRGRLPAQLALGAVYALGFFGAIAGSALFDDGALAGAVFSAPGPREGAADGGEGLLTGLLASAVLYVPTMMMLWFAPVLVAWHSITPAKAVFYSLVAFWLNLRAFIAYAFALGLVLFAAMGALFLLTLLIPSGAETANARSLVLPLALIVLPTLFASYFASYRDVFGGTEPS
jgi:hypothetical protein